MGDVFGRVFFHASHFQIDLGRQTRKSGPPFSFFSHCIEMFLSKRTRRPGGRWINGQRRREAASSKSWAQTTSSLLLMMVVVLVLSELRSAGYWVLVAGAESYIILDFKQRHQ